MVVLFAAIGAAYCLGYAVVGPSLGLPVAAIIAYFALSMCFALIPIFVRRTGSIRWASHMFAVTWSACALGGMILRGGVDNPVPMMFAPLPLLVMVLSGRRDGAIWFGLSLTLVIVFAVLPDLGVVLLEQISPADRVFYNVGSVVAVMIFMVLAALGVSALDASQKNSLRSATKQRHAAENEAQMLRAGRLAALGEVASSLAHEINNPLMYAMANLEFLVDDDMLSPDAREACVDAHAGTLRIAAIVKDLRAYASSDDTSIEPVDLTVVANSTARLVGGYVKSRATLVLDLKPCPPIDGNWAQLGQVVINLVVNSAQSIEPGSIGSNEITIRTGVDGELSFLEVSDSGCGISADDLANVTEPFFTTERGGGTGLGLSVTKNIVEQLGGTLDIESTVGSGTTVRVLLQPTPEESRRDRRLTLPSLETPLRILLIDAEPLMATSLARMLVEHELTVVDDVERAAELLREKPFLPDMIMLDSHRGSDSSWEWFVELEKRDAELADRVVFLVGGIEKLSSRLTLVGREERTLVKPVPREELASMLAKRVTDRALKPFLGKAAN